MAFCTLFPYTDTMIYLFLVILVYCINVMPGLMPPTWSVLAFFTIASHTAFISTVILGATFATLGRFTLYYLSKKYFYRFFSQKSQENFKAVGTYLNKKQKLSIPLFLLYLFMPFPSTQVFIGAGIADIHILPILLLFFLGRLLSYSLWISSTNIVVSRLDFLVTGYFAKSGTLISNIVAFILLYLFSVIDWKKILQKKKNRRQ